MEDKELHETIFLCSKKHFFLSGYHLLRYILSQYTITIDGKYAKS